MLHEIDTTFKIHILKLSINFSDLVDNVDSVLISKTNIYLKFWIFSWNNVQAIKKINNSLLFGKFLLLSQRYVCTCTSQIKWTGSVQFCLLILYFVSVVRVITECFLCAINNYCALISFIRKYYMYMYHLICVDFLYFVQVVNFI